MGVYYHASIIYGVNYEFKQVVESTVTRYNNVTGKKYEKKVKSSRQVIAGSNIVIPDWDWEENLMHGMDFGVFGIDIGDIVDDDKDQTEIDIDALKNARVEFSEVLKQCFPKQPDLWDQMLERAKLRLCYVGM